METYTNKKRLKNVAFDNSIEEINKCFDDLIIKVKDCIVFFEKTKSTIKKTKDLL